MIRVDQVRLPSTTETGTTLPWSGTAQTVATSPATAADAELPSLKSMRTMRAGSLEAGRSEPTCRRRPMGSSTSRRMEVGPSERISTSRTLLGRTTSNGWVQPHTRQRQTPRRCVREERLPRSIRRRRWGVSRPQLSHFRVAAWRRVTLELSGSVGTEAGSPLMRASRHQRGGLTVPPHEYLGGCTRPEGPLRSATWGGRRRGEAARARGRPWRGRPDGVVPHPRASF